MREILQAQARRLRRLQALQSGRALEITERALRRIQGRLDDLSLGPWDRAAHTSIRVQLALGLQELARDQVGFLEGGLPRFARQSWNDTKAVLRHQDRLYHGSVRPLRFDALEWLETNTRQLSQVRLQEYRRSFARYGAGAVRTIENEVTRAVLTGEPWMTARDKVWDAVRHVVDDRQWMVDRILRTESHTVYNGVRLAALVEEDDPSDPMFKRLVATFDERTGQDSYMLDGQIRPVRDPFFDAFYGKTYMAPPNRPNDREIVVGWRASYGEAFEESDPVDSAPTQGEDRKPTGGPIQARRRVVRRHIRALERQLAGILALVQAGEDRDQALEEVLRKRRDNLVTELRSLDSQEGDLYTRPITKAHMLLLHRIHQGGRIRPSSRVRRLLRDLEQDDLVRRNRQTQSGYVLTLSGLALLDRNRPQNPDRIGLTSQ